nr:outer envelope protein 61 [Ziziphus jujuba var. spinosa]
MSCYLKTKQYDECIKEGSEVLEHDAKNVKALYRRGQAYKELGQLEDAVSDLSKALEVTPDDETIADVLRDAKERLGKQGVSAPRRGLVIEEINEEAEPVSSNNNGSSSTDYSIPQSQKTSDSSKSQNVANNGDLSTNSEYLKALNNDPEAIRSFQNFISNADPSTLAALNPGNSGEISPDMIKTASQMISKMSPGELQRMIGMASSYQGASSDSNFNSFKPGSVPNVTPDMFKTASDMMSKMPPEELQKMFERTSLKGSDPFTRQAAPSANRQNSDAGPKYSSDRENSEGNGASAVGETSSRGMFSNSRSIPLQSSFPSSAADLQEQMRNQMKDPATRQMFASMMKNMSPEMMANMSEQFGLKLSQEDAAKAQQAMSSLSPEDLDKMMRWADRIQKVAEGAKKTKNWLLGRPGMILAIFMLILAVILHRLGYIGS